MPEQNKIKYSLNNKWLSILIIIVLVIGVYFRVVNLDKKVYWGDESFTSLRISGYTLQEFQNQAFIGKEMTLEELHKYQYPNPEKSVIGTIKGLAAEEPQHPPFYFVILRLWVQLFGNSVTVIRSFSVLVSLLAFPAIYWLCQELFNTPLTGWMTIALIAVSPFHLLYAQEARSYSLWTLTILLSSAALLQAIRLKTKVSWGIYVATLALGLYTFVLSGLVAIGHGIYVLVNEGFRFSKIVKNYLLASLTVFILFIPWIIATIANFVVASGTTGWTSEKVSLTSLVKTWVLNISRIFFDLNDSFIFTNGLIYIGILILVGYSLYFICRQSPKRFWSFVLGLIGVTALALALPDLILGGIRSGVARYLIPCYLGCQIAVGYLLADKISYINISKWRNLWQIITVVIISTGIISCAVIFQAETWWNKYLDYYYPSVAKIVNQSEKPLLIAYWVRLPSLSHNLDRKVILQSFNVSRFKLSSREIRGVNL
ncbi:MAG: hypothetical protein F6K10_17475 [Moorea sp. SIO2B7]|nr:hypothetical protein [Moorena sp. SIO2B7]